MINIDLKVQTSCLGLCRVGNGFQLHVSDGEKYQRYTHSLHYFVSEGS